MKYLGSIILPVFLAVQLHAFIDFEQEMISPFIVENRRIEIPCFPNAFNPSIVRFKGALLMSFRVGNFELASDSEQDSFLMSFRFRSGKDNSTNQIALVFLDADFNVSSVPQVLDIQYDDTTIAARQQDPRLIMVRERLYMAYSNIIVGQESSEIRRMFLAELVYKDGYFKVTPPVCLANFEGQLEQRWQKNWVPFEYDNQLLLAYSIDPHQIFKPDLKSGDCATVSSTAGNLSWDWGVLRGGTPALLDEGEYLAFFHSSKEMKSGHSNGKKIQHYFMGAYTFSPHPPFTVTSISRAPMVGKGFYHGHEYETWKPLRVVFPGGFVADSQSIWIAYGRQDHEIWIAKLDRKGLRQSLMPVSS